MRRIAHFKYGNKEVEINVSTVLQTGVLQSPVYSGVFYVTFSLLVCVCLFFPPQFVNVWYSVNGERLGTYNGHTGAVWCVDVDCILQ